MGSQPVERWVKVEPGERGSIKREGVGYSDCAGFLALLRSSRRAGHPLSTFTQCSPGCSVERSGASSVDDVSTGTSLSPHHSTTPVAGEDELRFLSRGCATGRSENDDLCAAGLLEALDPFSDHERGHSPGSRGTASASPARNRVVLTPQHHFFGSTEGVKASQ